MPNNLDEPTTRIHVHLYERDIARIKAIAGRTAFNKVVRNIVRTMLDNIEAKAMQGAKPVQIKDLNL